MKTKRVSGWRTFRTVGVVAALSAFSLALVGCPSVVPPPGCDDGDACTIDTLGADGVCVNTPTTCNDGQTCDPATGECAATDPCAGVTCDAGESCVDGACVADVSAGFTKADGINGGALYDKFWATETGFDQADANLDIYSGAGNFFRCKQCHAWDRLANTSSYIDRGPKTTRPNVSGVLLTTVVTASTPQELFDLIKTGDGAARRDVDADLSTNDPDADPPVTEVGDQMPDYSQILTDEQVWDLVKYFIDEALDTTQLFDVATEGSYPTGSRTFSNVGLDGDAINGNDLYATNCAGCHGANGRDGAAFPIADGDFSVGSFARTKPYEMWHKVKFGQLGSPMTAQGIDTLEDMQDLLAATADVDAFPDPTP